MLTIETAELDGNIFSVLPVGRFLSGRTKCPFFARLSLCWTTVGRWLLVSSAPWHLEQVAAAIESRGARLIEAPATTALVPRSPAECSEWILVRGTAVSEMLHSWLDYLTVHRPEALTHTFWADWLRQRIEHHRRLGVALKNRAKQPGEAEVVEVDPNSAAAKALSRGDVILAVDGRKLATSRPAQDVADRFRQAPGNRMLRLTVRRGRSVYQVSIPPPAGPVAELESFDPIAVVRSLAALTGPIDALAVWRRPSEPESGSARVLVRWKRPADRSDRQAAR